ncbi:DUF6612 family protein [Mumia sp. DW29H23]|uniref:DUF6612 family protein n=1 Tax=Mumia sp. DW29H23 TaxID=3421241 RepID=UPI003D68069A
MRTRTLTTALAALALALTAGCGSSADVAGDDGGSTSSSSSSGSTTSGGGGDEGATVLTSENFASVVSGAQLKAQTAHMTLTMNVAGQNVKAEADVKTDSDPTKGAMHMTMDVAGQSVDMIMVDGVIYMKAPGMPDGKWMSIDLDEAAGAAGASFEQMRESMDPSQSIKNLEDAMSSLKDTGETATIDGVEARRYDAVLDTSKIAGMEGGAAAQIPDQITYQYWVGPDQLPRKIVVDLAATPMEMTFTKWGEDVDVQAPPAADVVDGSSMMDGLPTP